MAAVVVVVGSAAALLAMWSEAPAPHRRRAGAGRAARAVNGARASRVRVIACCLPWCRPRVRSSSCATARRRVAARPRAASRSPRPCWPPWPSSRQELALGGGASRRPTTGGSPFTLLAVPASLLGGAAAAAEGRPGGLAPCWSRCPGLDRPGLAGSGDRRLGDPRRSVAALIGARLADGAGGRIGILAAALRAIVLAGVVGVAGIPVGASAAGGTVPDATVGGLAFIVVAGALALRSAAVPLHGWAARLADGVPVPRPSRPPSPGCRPWPSASPRVDRRRDGTDRRGPRRRARDPRRRGARDARPGLAGSLDRRRPRAPRRVPRHRRPGRRCSGSRRSIPLPGRRPAAGSSCGGGRDGAGRLGGHRRRRLRDALASRPPRLGAPVARARHRTRRHRHRHGRHARVGGSSTPARRSSTRPSRDRWPA